MTLHAPGVPIQVEMVEILGSEQLIHGVHGDSPVIIRCPVELTRSFPIEVGEAIQVGITSTDRLHWFDRDTGVRIQADT